MKGHFNSLHFSPGVGCVLAALQGWRRMRHWMTVKYAMEKMIALAVIMFLTLENLWIDVDCV